MFQAVGRNIENFVHRTGAKATYYYVDSSSGISSDGTVPSSKTSETVKMVIDRFESSQIDGQVIQREDLWGISAATDFTKSTPSNNDEIEDKNGNKYTVIGIKPRYIEHEPISYEFHLRQ